MGKIINSQNILFGKIERKRLLGRPWCRLENNILDLTVRSCGLDASDSG
jgi:hypothetical protein